MKFLKEAVNVQRIKGVCCFAPGEHELFLRKYKIQETFIPNIQFDIGIQPIQNQNELSALFYHMINPDHYPDPYEEIKEYDTNTSSYFPCEICDGHYVVRHGSNGSFLDVVIIPDARVRKPLQIKLIPGLSNEESIYMKLKCPAGSVANL